RLDRQRAEFEKLDVALLDGALVHHVARDAQEAHLDVGGGGLLLGDLVELEREVPAEHTSTPLVRGASLPVPTARRNSAAIWVTSPTLTGASTAPTWTMRPARTPCSQE